MRRLAIAGLFALAACSDDNLAAGRDVRACFAPEECVGGQVCFNGECRFPDELSIIDIEVTPLSSSGFVSQQFLRREPRNGQLALTLDRPLLVDGTLKARDGRSAYGAKVHFDPASPFSVIPGLMRRRTLVSDADGKFTAQLGRGDYQVTAWTPDFDPAPPTATLVNLTGSLVRDFELPALAELTTISGSLAKAAGGEAIGGAKMQLYDPLGKRAVCKPVESDSDGSFALLLAPGVTAAGLMVRVGLGPSNAFVPVIEFPAGAGPLQLVTGAFAAPAAEHVHITAGGSAVEGALVKMEGLVQGTATGLFAAQATTDPNGRATLMLLPGDYDMTVTPPETTALGISRRTAIAFRTANDPGTAEAVDLLPRLVWSGRVLDPDGLPLADVRVTATRVASEILAAAPARMFETLTDADGKFTLLLDESAEWRVSLDPPPIKKLPREPNIPLCVARVSSQCPRGLPASIRLKRSAALLGVVNGIGSDGNAAPLAGATVDIYERSGDGLSSFLAGTALTDDKGHFEVTLKQIEP